MSQKFLQACETGNVEAIVELLPQINESTRHEGFKTALFAEQIHVFSVLAEYRIDGKRLDVSDFGHSIFSLCFDAKDKSLLALLTYPQSEAIFEYHLIDYFATYFLLLEKEEIIQYLDNPYFLHHLHYTHHQNKLWEEAINQKKFDIANLLAEKLLQLEFPLLAVKCMKAIALRKDIEPQVLSWFFEQDYTQLEAKRFHLLHDMLTISCQNSHVNLLTFILSYPDFREHESCQTFFHSLKKQYDEGQLFSHQADFYLFFKSLLETFQSYEQLQDKMETKTLKANRKI